MEEEKMQKSDDSGEKSTSGLMNKLPGVLKKENFVVFILCGILLLVITFPTGKKENAKMESENTDRQSATMFMDRGGGVKEDDRSENTTGQEWQDYVNYLEEALEELLGTMEGAGRVKVMITLHDTGEQIVEKDITERLKGDTHVETAASDHITDRESEQVTVLASYEKGLSSPYVKQVISPKVKGVAVSVQGGGNPEINKNISETIQALFGIDVHKIKIIKMSTQS